MQRNQDKAESPCIRVWAPPHANASDSASKYISLAAEPNTLSLLKELMILEGISKIELCIAEDPADRTQSTLHVRLNMEELGPDFDRLDSFRENIKAILGMESHEHPTLDQIFLHSSQTIIWDREKQSSGHRLIYDDFSKPNHQELGR